MTVTPVVLGDLGVIGDLAGRLESSGVVEKEQALWFMAAAQREVLCAAVKIIKRHMTLITPC